MVRIVRDDFSSNPIELNKVEDERRPRRSKLDKNGRMMSRLRRDVSQTTEFQTRRTIEGCGEAVGQSSSSHVLSSPDFSSAGRHRQLPPKLPLQRRHRPSFREGYHLPTLSSVQTGDVEPLSAWHDTPAIAIDAVGREASSRWATIARAPRITSNTLQPLMASTKNHNPPLAVHAHTYVVDRFQSLKATWKEPMP